MNSILKTFTLSLFFTNIIVGVFAQNNAQNGEPVLQRVSNKAVVQSAFPEATKVEKINEFWFKIVDDNNKLFGYAMTSTDHCKDVIGYNNVTPIMVITDKNFVIRKVALLSHYESPGYIRRLQQMGFFGTWDDLKLNEARKIKADAYTGATLTAKAVEKNLYFLIDNGGKKLPKK
jgi:Na+-translocating ferredoxin:NAD+ oxidoreductase RnfG subunit